VKAGMLEGKEQEIVLVSLAISLWEGRRKLPTTRQREAGSFCHQDQLNQDERKGG